MVQQVVTHVRRNLVLAIALATVAAASLLAPEYGVAQGSWLRRATLACQEAGGTLTTPGSGVIFACTFPASINLSDILGTPLLIRTLPKICFGPARGGRYGPDYSANAVDCLE